MIYVASKYSEYSPNCLEAERILIYFSFKINFLLKAETAESVISSVFQSYRWGYLRILHFIAHFLETLCNRLIIIKAIYNKATK